MKIIKHIRQDGPFGEYWVELTEEERSDRVDARTFRALNIVESIYNRYGIFVAMLAAIPLAAWSDLK